MTVGRLGRLYVSEAQGRVALVRVAFHGDEREELGPQELFDENDARRAIPNLQFVAEICARLTSEAG